ncbi:MAG TPA: porin [Methylomirabilota bacterium]|nr:porin [Methylomirabilota bacterium]
MKKALLGTTALVAAGFAVGDAYAADTGVQLTIGGRYMGAAGALFGENSDFYHGSNTRNYVFKQDVEVYFQGHTTLDNGLEVGARVELEGQTQTSDQIDAVYAYFSGGFGQVRFGDTGEALGQMCYLVPSASQIFGADSPNFNFSNAGLKGYGATNGTCYGVDDKATKVVYFSPNFGGFTFAASFAPDGSEDTHNTFQGAGTRLNNAGGGGHGTGGGNDSENLSLAANYTHDFNGVHLVVGGGYTHSFNREVNPNSVNHRSEYNGYAQVGFSGFTFGGAVSLRQNQGLDGQDDLIYGAGVTYNWDAWTVGFGWTHGDYELIKVGESLGGGSTATGNYNEHYNVFALTAAYALGPGIELDGVLEYDVAKGTDTAFTHGEVADAGKVSGNTIFSGFSVGLGTLINF